MSLFKLPRPQIDIESLRGRVFGFAPGYLKSKTGIARTTPADFARMDAIVNESCRVSVSHRQRLAARNAGIQIGGVACRYNVVFGRSRLNTDNRPVLFRPGCFGSIPHGSVSFRSGHWNAPLARNGGGSFTLMDSRELGLFIHLNLSPDTPELKTFISDVDAGRLTELSIEHRTLEEQSTDECRIITKAELTGVAAVGPGRGSCPDTYLRIAS